MANFTYTYQGLHGLKAISENVGIPVSTLYHRIYQGLTLEQAIESGKRAEYPKNRIETTGRRSHQVKRTKNEVIEGIRHPDLLDGHWKLALGMRA
ncbi:hypothetical protein K6U56_12485 [Vibrio furnissii]|uniref:hypothetical protein n=1 Tax=Vibrio furnissii TaxID=29494 RepID=UPI001EEA1BAC|nr:hypothetical protein [Vibrio furnissii]MCG6212776.1 hypothetical protein [Vibrio furnissii]